MKPIEGRAVEFKPRAPQEQEMPPLLEGFLVELKRDHNITPKVIALNEETFQKLMCWYLSRYDQDAYFKKLHGVYKAFMEGDKRVVILGISFRRACWLNDDVLATFVPVNEIDIAEQES